jgi:mono/diheme cytochrome c family protein
MKRLLLVPMLGLLAATAGCEQEEEGGGWANFQNFIFQRMQKQPKFLPYQRNDFYEDLRAMRPPPPGTLSREAYGGSQGGIDTGRTPNLTYVEKIPVPVNEELLAAGRRHFQIVCATCHGLAGDGRSVVAMNMALMPAPSFHSEKLIGKPDGYIFEVISDGYGAMPAQGWRFPPKDRWGVVAYVRALQYSQHVPIAEAPPDVRSRLMREAQ